MILGNAGKLGLVILKLGIEVRTLLEGIAGYEFIFSANFANKLTYDAFSENTTSYLNGKAAQEQVNDLSFV